MKLTKLFNEFFESKKAGGFILIFATLLSLCLANSVIAYQYSQFWHLTVFNHSLEFWINDGLMTIFFLLIGLELEREVYKGELSSFKNAALPLFAAIGGMIVPALIFYSLNKGLPTQAGIGIPMATDIAFAIGILSLLGNRVPITLKLFLTALAVIDDLGAIIIIAIFYSATISIIYLGVAIFILGFLFLLNRLKVFSILPYAIGGIAMWYCMLQSGVHPTITGILLAFVIPFGNGNEQSLAHKLQHYLHKPVAYFILPLFALANTCITFQGNWLQHLQSNNSWGIALGLVIGKPIGICVFSFVAVLIGICSLPAMLKWKHIIGASILGGIGFTMSIFVTQLAYADDELIKISKITILLSSLLAAITGFVWLKWSLKDKV